MDKSGKWSWRSALVGAAAATAATVFVLGRPKDPSFHLTSIKPTSIKLEHLPLFNTDLIVTVHVNNPNIVPIQYSPSEFSIFYGGSLLGAAHIQAGSQPPMSCRMLKLTAKLDGLKLRPRLLSDVAKREMVLDAVGNIEGSARLLWWTRKFQVNVDSHLVIDPIFLDVIEQDNKSALQLFLLEKDLGLNVGF